MNVISTDVQTLLDVGDDDCSDFIVPETIHGSVTALKHMLNNQLVFNAGHYNKKKIPRKQKVPISGCWIPAISARGRNRRLG